MRINAYLAKCGVAARRKADALISSGTVRVDGRIAKLGDMVDPARQSITVAGKPVSSAGQATLTIALNKPRGVVSTMRDPKRRPTIADLLPAEPRMFPVGRLDAETTGLLLCTSDGALAGILAHPRYGVAKLYRVEVEGDVTRLTARALKARLVRSAPATLEFELREGKNREIRRMCARQGLRVKSLERISFGPVSLGSLRPGRSRHLTAAEHAALERLRTQASQENRRTARRDQPDATGS